MAAPITLRARHSDPSESMGSTTNQLESEGVLGGVENTRCSVVSKMEWYADSSLNMFTTRRWCYLAEFYAPSIVLSTVIHKFRGKEHASKVLERI